MARRPTEDPRRLAGVVASYVLAHPTDDALRAGLPELYGYARRQGIALGSREELDRAVLAHAARLREAVERQRSEARLFKGDRPPRPVRYRHGAPFCPVCGMFKDARKECGHCGHLEMTT